ncbi:MAG: M23 family metallopeptidase [Saprospiraceae bacterium]|nr:M23 family metallopeptidase [Saprospiraceae bacterium]MBK8511280.1 M23 family metallopeptidase [Saprospiraceae bacterium]MBK9677893.1 M23 family metallopeptidase [Saprospiraceae bacterium]
MAGKTTKYVFNQHTLQFEKSVEPIKIKLVKIFSFLSTALVSGLLVFFIFHKYLPSPNEKILVSELETVQQHYGAMADQLDLMAKALDNIQKRDADVHRQLLGMDPIDEDIWNGGKGGHDLLNEFRNLPTTGELVGQTANKLSQLERQLVLQSQSLDKLQESASHKEEMLASIPSIKPVRVDKLNRSLRFLSGFGMRLHPIHKIRKMHTGIDFSAPKGTPIQVTGNGRVVEIEKNYSGYGNCVRVDHGFGYLTLYAHMDRVDVKVGQEVKKGNQLGVIGSTGSSTAPHCHYEVRYKGTPINPINFCLDNLTPLEYQELVKLSEQQNQSLD